MRYIDIRQHLESIASQGGKESESVSIRIALENYKNLRGFRRSEGHVLMATDEVNQFCTHVEFAWDDQGQLMAMPHIEDKKIRIYSNPTVFFVGYRNPNGFGIVPFQNWERYFEEFQIAPEVVKIIQDHLANHAPIDYR